jgi:hypothetical protein
MTFELRRHARNVHSFKFKLKNQHDVQSVMLLSDLHWDNPHCDRELLAKHLDEAKRRQAPVLLIGDSYCCMEGRGDLRADRNIRPEHNNNRYLDSLVETFAEWLKPWYSVISVIGVGNHETSVQKRHDTCLVSRLCQTIRTNGGIAQEGGYGGWVRFHFRMYETMYRSNTLYYHHGFGGGSPSTRATNHFTTHYSAQTSGNIDIYAAGHTHWKEAVPVRKAKLNGSNKVELVDVHYLRLGTYKDEYSTDGLGFHIEKGRGARALGGYIVNFTMHKKDGIRRTVEELN